MNLKHRILVATAACILSTTAALAQSNGSNSPYSRFGMGLVNDQSQGPNRSMGGIGQGLRNGARVNMLNPASYSATDSLSFIFDIGMGLQRNRLTQNGAHQSVNNTTFDYVNAAFRLMPKLGMSVGFMPYTSIGYTFSQDFEVMHDDVSNQTITQEQTYTGSGGLRQAYLGVGWMPLKNLSIGANVGFLWGDVDHGVTQSFAEDGKANTTYYGGLITVYSADLRTWKADIGLQYSIPLNKEDELTLGATVGLGHKISGEATMLRISLNADTIVRSTNNAFQLPMTYSVGATWKHKQKWTVGADFTLEQWADCVAPHIESNSDDANEARYVATKGCYSNRFRINAGAEYIPDRYGRSYIQRINYRFGAYFSTPYLKINGLDGPKEFGLTAGVGLPVNFWHSRSQVNFGVQWARRNASAAGMINENILRINLGVTFNEAWFMKWKID